jgi:hypothetical protein
VKDFDQKVFNYLLGELPEEEQLKIEEQYVSDKELQERLLIVEDELIDAYVGNELGESQRERFETYFLRSSQRKERLKNAKALAGYINNLKESEKPSLHIPFAGALRYGSQWGLRAALIAMLVLATGSLWLILEVSRLRDQLKQMEARQLSGGAEDESLRRQLSEQRRRADGLAEQLESERSQRLELAFREPGLLKYFCNFTNACYCKKWRSEEVDDTGEGRSHKTRTRL